MRPAKRDQGGQQDLLRSRLDQIVALAHPLAKLGRSIDWSFLEQRLGAVYTDGPGRPPLPTRLMAGLAILKHMHNLSDEVLCERWLENPYYQLLCGEEFFCHKLPFDRSSMTRWRQRMGEEKLGALLQESLHPQRCGQAGRLHPRHRRHHGAAEGDHLPDRCEAAAAGPRAAGEAGP
jgi:transposase, IS5 family